MEGIIARQIVLGPKRKRISLSVVTVSERQVSSATVRVIATRHVVSLNPLVRSVAMVSKRQVSSAMVELIATRRVVVFHDVVMVSKRQARSAMEALTAAQTVVLCRRSQRVHQVMMTSAAAEAMMRLEGVRVMTSYAEEEEMISSQVDLVMTS